LFGKKLREKLKGKIKKLKSAGTLSFLAKQKASRGDTPRFILLSCTIPR
jgi:hypothetical protein